MFVKVKKLILTLSAMVLPLTFNGLYADEAGDGQGSAAGVSTQGASSKLEYCPESLGTLALYENQRDSWWYDYHRRYPSLGTTVPVLRLMVQQSNCFVVVERGKALRNIKGELEQSGELRSGSNFGKGQIVAADFTMTPSISFQKILVE